MDYKKQAQDFCKKYGVKINIKKSPFQSPPLWITNENEDYGIKYSVRIERSREKWTFSFWDSVANKNNEERPNIPNIYDVLACITKNNPEDYKDFCDCYGYEFGEIGTRKIYNAVVEEWKNVRRLFSDCMEELQEIN